MVLKMVCEREKEREREGLVVQGKPTAAGTEFEKLVLLSH